MINILITTHGELAKGIVNSAKMIIGKFENVEYLVFDETMGISIYEEKLAQILMNVDEERQWLIFTDILGGTPFNTVSKFSFNNDNIAVFYGINLPLLMEAILTKEGKKVQEMAQSLIKTLPDTAGLSTI
ncbi:mannose/fructose/sorbose-specific phosphotransferase system IIA component [Breznakia sp. PF5-3]|uniref:PTS sugar transporter subunit IIA n=1 Tax=unclassified Breznakia TaxID=2623764 RepID=UPI002406D0A9|nr:MULTISPECIES: hypothetical protein [unclassified Breznakia]MDF9824749.1 mannose/fructose/sorbose-specific phosphotransferase system IIA component [Breznakia sp. PM6-1]MDF9835684.1 mannose/fructose/sorbose-specific phosphotransferase system IIA component [Breznakia sp. PF5-3]MDF9837733.1 mannose/fructose/sorbose-specific phosphotransferase system IIA component [Breznakia sp. PFB2-8]MDF9859694.1 mannose/fructose/sorbose-specific phosphotransferase system IIA component [Breznakia sp. PH5-24]